MMRCRERLVQLAVSVLMLLSVSYLGPTEARDNIQNNAGSQLELSHLIKLFMLPREASYNILPWASGGDRGTPIEWNHAGIVECESWIERQFHQPFCRSGSVVVTVRGKPTHTVLGKTLEPGRWNIRLMGPHAGASLVEISSDVNSQELDPDLVTHALKVGKADSLSLKSFGSCAEEYSEMFIASGGSYQPLPMTESRSCGSAGCSIEILLGRGDASKDCR
jgi:hypothetical protein